MIIKCCEGHVGRPSITSLLSLQQQKKTAGPVSIFFNVQMTNDARIQLPSSPQSSKVSNTRLLLVPITFFGLLSYSRYQNILLSLSDGPVVSNL